MPPSLSSSTFPLPSSESPPTDNPHAGPLEVEIHALVVLIRERSCAESASSPLLSLPRLSNWTSHNQRLRVKRGSHCCALTAPCPTVTSTTVPSLRVHQASQASVIS